MKLEKILALVLAAMMVLGMSSVVMAETTVKDGVGAAGAATTDATSMKIYKSVVVENPQANITVAYPTMNFTYTVAPKTPAEGANVKDSDGDVAAVVAGVENGVTLSNAGAVTIPTGTVTLNKNGQEIVDAALQINVDLTMFNSPGIYRYVITDTTTEAALTAPGVVRSDSLDKSYILDVYLHNEQTSEGSEGSEGTLAVAGYVLTKEEVEHIDETTPKDSGFDNVKVITTEVPGTPGSEGQPGTDPTVTRKLDDTTPATLEGNDFYYTYNATLSKTVTGAMGDKNNTFEFDLAVTNTANNQTLNYYVDARTTKGAQTKAEKTENLNKAFLKGTDVVTIYGLNPYATVNYTETNNTASTYTKVIVKNGTEEATTEVKTQNNVTAGGTVPAYNTAQNIVTWATNAKAAKAAAINVAYENNLSDVSPTGIVLRFGPYIAMFAAGAALFLILLAKRRKKDEEAE